MLLPILKTVLSAKIVMKLRNWLLLKKITNTSISNVTKKGCFSVHVTGQGFKMSPGLEERRIAAVVGALVADAAGMFH